MMVSKGVTEHNFNSRYHHIPNDNSVMWRLLKLCLDLF